VLVTEHEGVPVVAVSGEVDLHAVPRFRSAMQDAVSRADSKRPLVLVDLGEVEFIDSSGLGVLIGQHRELGDVGGELRVVAGEAALKILRLTSLDTALDVYDRRGQAFYGRSEGSS